jgi:CBS-domain-containing membrane protein
MTIISVGRVFWARRLLGVPIWHWINGVLFPVGVVALAAVAAAMIPRWLLPPSYARLALVVGGGIITTVGTAWFLACNENERSFVKLSTMHLLEKLNVRVLNHNCDIH